MVTKKIFLASSSALQDDREAFTAMIGTINNTWHRRGIYFELIVWEEFLDVMSQTRLQDEYNKEICRCELFVMLYNTKVGRYTEEEFETAFEHFKSTNKPFILTYFKDAAVPLSELNEADVSSLIAFRKKLKTLGHFETVYRNTDHLENHFKAQLDKLAASGFLELRPEQASPGNAGSPQYTATMTGNGALAQGAGALAAAAGAVVVGGGNTGVINTGTYITHNGDIIGHDKISISVAQNDGAPMFAALRALTADLPPAKHKVEALAVEVAKGEQADDAAMAGIIEGLVALVPSAVGAVVGLFATPVLSGLATPVTSYVLNKLKGQ